MFGKGNDWGLVPTGDTVMMVLGGIDKKPTVINDKIEIREFLSVTLEFDHDIIDGATVTRFGVRLKNLIENADDLK